MTLGGQMERPEWIARAQPVEAVTIDVGFLINDSFYYGSENGFTQQEWQQLREPLYRPTIELYGDYAFSQCLVPSATELIRYYQDVLRLIDMHKKQRKQNSHYFWLRPVIFTRGVFAITFPWYDTWRESERLLNGLSANGEGEIDDDIDQGWQFSAFADGERLFLRQYDPDYDQEHFCIATDRSRLTEQIPAVRERMSVILQELRSTFGQDYWSARW